MHSKKTKGFSLVQFLILFVLLVVCIMSVYSMFLYYKTFETKLKTKVAADQVLVNTAQIFQVWTLKQTQDYCQFPALATEVNITGKCSVGEAFNTGADTATGTDPLTGEAKFLNVRYNINGIPDNAGIICPELVQCRLLEAGQMIELSLRVAYLEPLTNILRFNKPIILRKSKW